jgi:TRAP-type C4-dicarboxylate transport system substrate-binding protein
MKRITVMVALVCAAIALPATTHAEEVPLKFAYTAPLASATYTQYWGPWVERVNKEGAGHLKIEVFGGNTLATIGNVYDRIVNNVAQIGYGIQAISGKFPLSEACTLPFLFEDAAPASTACWNIYADGTIAREYDDVQPIAIWTFTQTTLHTNKPVLKAEDMKGLKIAVTAKPTGDAIQAVGGTPVAMAITDFYPSLSRGVVDGIGIAWIGVMQFKVHEVTKYHLDIALGSGTGFIAMNKRSYASLPASAKQIIDRNSGREVSVGFAKVVDGIQAQQRAAVAGMPGHTLTKLDAAEEQRWRAMAEPVIDQWAKATPNGAQALAAFKAELAKAKGAAGSR